MRRSLPSVVATAAVLAIWLAGANVAGRDAVLLRVGDAFVSEQGAVLTIGSALVRYALERRGQAVLVRAIADPLSDRDWHRSTGADSTLVVNGERVEIGSASTEFLGAAVSEHRSGARLDLKYRVPAAALDVTRSYVAYPGSPVIETWSRYVVTGTRPVILSSLTGYTFSVEAGQLRIVNGVNAPASRGGPFTIREDDVRPGAPVEVGSAALASDEYIPSFGVRVGEAQFFGALLWSGSWRLRAERQNDAIALELGLPPFRTALPSGAALEGPHAIFGITNAFVPEMSMALKGFIDGSLRRGRPFAMPVSYLATAPPSGAQDDERSLATEMAAAAAAGVELFVVDRGWARDGDGWRADERRFPTGLRALSDRAHGLGMRFGLAVEPERAGQAQICLADAAARDGTLSRLLALIDDVQPDELKWDLSAWLDCNRPGHGHGAEDGNFQHTRGLHAVLERLRERHPHLEIENSAGGRRLSLDMLALTDAGGFGGDASAAARPSARGLSGIFPAPYLLSRGAVDEPADLLRSRMSGRFGLSRSGVTVGNGRGTDLAREIALYKQIRPILQDSTAILLGDPPAPGGGGPSSGWDVVMHVSRTTGEAVILAFTSAGASGGTVVYPRALRQDALYDVESADFGMLGSATGATLMSHGIEIQASRVSRSRVLILRARARDER